MIKSTENKKKAIGRAFQTIINMLCTSYTNNELLLPLSNFVEATVPPTSVLKTEKKLEVALLNQLEKEHVDPLEHSQLTFYIDTLRDNNSKNTDALLSHYDMAYDGYRNHDKIQISRATKDIRAHTKQVHLDRVQVLMQIPDTLVAPFKKELGSYIKAVKTAYGTEELPKKCYRAETPQAYSAAPH